MAEADEPLLFYDSVLAAVERLLEQGRIPRRAVYRRFREDLRKRTRNAPNQSFQLKELDRAIRLIEKRIKVHGLPLSKGRSASAPPLVERGVRKARDTKRLPKRIVENKSPREIKKQSRLAEKQKKRREQERKKVLARAPSRAELAEVASPQPVLSNGILHAGPNHPYDLPSIGIGDNLSTLPMRQRALIRTITSDLPRNAPAFLTTALANYADELEARGTQPILGLLKDMAAIVEAGVATYRDDEDWLSGGMRVAFSIFAENHFLFLKYFPLDPKREDIYSRTPVDENKVAGANLSQPFKKVADATVPANHAGLTTDEFSRIVHAMAEFSKVLATLPLKSSEKSSEIEVTPDDRIIVGEPVSSKKRMLLSGIGFFERVYNLMGSSATLSGPAEGNALLQALREAVSSLSSFVIGK
jgi:hypothetical protein